ncbi:MAG: hypothetical protein K0Q92_1563 [Steroidobacteraceae bacterium]|jgi:uncharacterized protein YegJ (DUF2314 family)|nr:hypothetical protein [Steroidobacteraceae bacterium]
MKLASLLMLSMFALAACAKESAPVTEREGEPMVTGFNAEDEGMNAAMRKARNTLAEFEARLSKPPATQQHIGLKGRFEEDGNVEHMWIDDIEITAEGYRGKLGNHPVDIQSIDVGSEVLVKRENVSDWMAIDDGKLVGGFTLRVQRGRMTPEQRADFDASADFVIED